MKWADDNAILTFFFEAFDEAWKGGGPGSGPHEVEKHWGVFTSDRQPKPVIHVLYPDSLLQQIAAKVSAYKNR